MKNKIPLIFATLGIFIIACTNKTKRQEPILETSQTEMIMSPEMTGEFNQAFAQQCVFTINEIDAFTMQMQRYDTIVNTGQERNMPVTYWKDNNNRPIKVEYGVKNDSGNYTSVFRMYFINGKLWIADQLYAKYVFDTDGALKYWLSETWTISETTISADFTARKNTILKKMDEVLFPLGLKAL